MSGTVIYPKVDRDACSPFQDGGHDFNFRPSVGELPRFVLVDRGNCFFTLKVWDAQLAGASAVLVADDREESLITMDAPDDDPDSIRYVSNISIPSALLQKKTSDAIKQALERGEMVNVNLDWREALPHSDSRVEYEFWTNSNDECGPKCDVQAEFLRQFKGLAVTMETGGFTSFTPHYITWFCPESYVSSVQCQSQCINHGRYCAPDPEEDFSSGYEGKDVVMENLRQLCAFRVAKEKGQPWLWWNYVTDFRLRCKMSLKNYNQDCAESVMSSLGLELRKVHDCVGDPTRDEENIVLKTEQEAQIGSGSRGDVTFLPTMVINNRQYRGKLDATAVLKAVCSAFQEATEPPQCLGSDIQTNDCLVNNGGCWRGSHNLTACKDTFRGRVCECPRDPTTGVNFIGDGYTSCEAAGPGRCLIDNGGCWQSTTPEGQHFTACQDHLAGTGCSCPAGFRGNGHTCEDVDECAEGLRCQCSGCSCKNTIGSFQCSCTDPKAVFIGESEICISRVGSGGASASPMGWMFVLVLGVCLVILSTIAVAVYRFRLRSYMDAEIRDIMAQYMPLEDQQQQTDSIHTHSVTPLISTAEP
eukprot:TRINITY_DN1813_c0_g1_i3.p1 TRINITY_DN1813_c0_g1~~TRINITY_DN1813_c0_g1_i3.p1  ORF type:complete len:606 (+),score=130.28 TRINITY_DN1813_c0_g1_i3:60-1820(+)